MDTLEIWKDVDGFDGRYQVSNIARVKSLGRSSGSGVKRFADKILKHSTPLGYARVSLYDAQTKKYTGCAVHRLVASVFVSNPDNKSFVNHINGVKLDNRPCNLEWVTAAENIHHAFRTGLTPLGENRSRSLFTNEQVIEIFLDNGPLAEVAAKYNTAKDNVSHIWYRKSYRTITAHLPDIARPPKGAFHPRTYGVECVVNHTPYKFYSIEKMRAHFGLPKKLTHDYIHLGGPESMMPALSQYNINSLTIKIRKNNV